MNQVQLKAERRGGMIRVSAGEFHTEFPEGDANRKTIATAAKMLLEMAAGFSEHDVFISVFELQMEKHA